MLFINKAGFILEDLGSDNIEALIVIMTAGEKNRNSAKIKNFISRYMYTYKEIETIKYFVIYDLKEKHGFITYKEKDNEPIHPLLKNKNKNKDKDKDIKPTHSEKLKMNKENYESIIRTYLKAGYKIDEILQMDLRYFDYIHDYVVRQHEELLNDLMVLAHRTGMMSGVGFVNLKNYPDKPEQVRLRPLTKEEIIANKEAEAKKFQAEAMADIKKAGGGV